MQRHPLLIIDTEHQTGFIDEQQALTLHAAAEANAKNKAQTEGKSSYGADEIATELEKLLLPILMGHHLSDEQHYNKLYDLIYNWKPNNQQEGTFGKYAEIQRILLIILPECREQQPIQQLVSAFHHRDSKNVICAYEELFQIYNKKDPTKSEKQIHHLIKEECEKRGLVLPGKVKDELINKINNWPQPRPQLLLFNLGSGQHGYSKLNKNIGHSVFEACPGDEKDITLDHKVDGNPEVLRRKIDAQHNNTQAVLINGPHDMGIDTNLRVMQAVGCILDFLRQDFSHIPPIIHIAGYSRGAVATKRIANALKIILTDENALANYKNIMNEMNLLPLTPDDMSRIKSNLKLMSLSLYQFDPVAGPTQRKDKDAIHTPDNVQSIYSFLAEHEDRSAFAEQGPTRSITDDPSKTEVHTLSFPGRHDSLVRHSQLDEDNDFIIPKDFRDKEHTEPEGVQLCTDLFTRLLIHQGFPLSQVIGIVKKQKDRADIVTVKLLTPLDILEKFSILHHRNSLNAKTITTIDKSLMSNILIQDSRNSLSNDER